MKVIKILLVLLLGFGFVMGAKFSKMVKNPILIQEGKEKPWCHICGMSLKMFYKTSHAVVLRDGTKRQYCSIRCLVADYPNIKDKIEKILVADAKTGKLIPVKKAFYVIGSKVPGTMSKVSKIAFLNKGDALKFQKEYGGEIANFDKAFKVAKSNFKKDLRMLMKKKKKMMYPKGKMIYNKLCKKDINPKIFKTIGELKTYIVKSNSCPGVKGKKLQALSLYIWEVKGKSKRGIQVPKDAKCPVCGMYVYKYPRWAAKMVFKNGRTYYFDGAKDMFKFLLNPKKFGYKKEDIKEILVSDYYQQKAIDARKAFFVLKSDVLGPMGNELIPFEDIKEAKTFLIDHKGKEILNFNQIDKKVIEGLD